MPLQGKVKDTTKYWSSDYWPLFRGNINFRWNSPDPIGFNLISPDFETAIRMTPAEIAQLSPSEKFDLFNGEYTYPLKAEVSKRSSPNRKEWEGICHGWAAAALNHKEPTPKIVTNPQGIMIPFGSSDIKALLSYYYAYHYRPVTTHQMGRRCDGSRFCEEDMNAGAFHIVMANRLGLQGESFIADIDNGREVWNHVAWNYRSEILERDLPPMPDSAKDTVKVVKVSTRFRVVFNIETNSWLPANGTELQTFKESRYEYYLDLNSKGEILGGEWISKARPDFLWLVNRTSKFPEKFEKLQRLLNERR